MKIPFTKLHGAKNDFLVTPAADVPITDLEELAIAICDRYTGVGADGWMLLDATEGPDYEATIRLFNSDGSEPELSGNGTRCAALLLVRGLPAERRKDPVRIRTGAGIKELRLISMVQDPSSLFERAALFEMDMGEPRVLELHAGIRGHDAVLLDAGNPQCAIPVESFEFDWRAAGAGIENDARFPSRTNVSFIRPVDLHTIDVRFWERGAGETNSSGTGSTGAALAAIARGLAKSPVKVLTPAGALELRLARADAGTGDSRTYLTGPAEYIADGFFYFSKIVS